MKWKNCLAAWAENILILTLSILPAHRSWDGFPDPSLMRRMSVLHQNSGGTGKSIPSSLKISLGPRVSGNLLAFGDDSLVLVKHGYNVLEAGHC